jgi:hypothetical protein
MVFEMEEIFKAVGYTVLSNETVSKIKDKAHSEGKLNCVEANDLNRG